MSDTSSSPSFDSLLPTGRERFLAQVMVHTLTEGWATPQDFLRHFPPQKLIESLADAEELRVNLLVKAAKVHQKAAAKKSIESASEDLEIAVTEGLCEPAEVLELYGPDDRVTFLPAPALWEFATEGDWWSVGSKEREFERALGRLVFIVERALAQNLMTLQELTDALTFDQIAGLLSEQRLQDVVRHALVTGRQGKALDEKSLLSVVPLEELLGLFELGELWNRVVLAVIAKPSDLLGEGGDGEAKGNAASKRPGSLTPGGKPAASTPKAGTPSKAPPGPGSSPAAASRPPAPAKASMPPAPPAAKAVSVPPPPPPPPPVSGAEDDETRSAVVERLTEIGRLPPSHAALPLPILLSIDGMYADLDIAESDEEREDAIREAFPNQLQLRQAMLALIELLDPTINTKDPLIRDAEVDSLIKIVMFEERRRR